MQLLKFKMPDDFNFFSFGDTHWGSALSSKHGWDVLVEKINSKYKDCKSNYAGNGGDSIEAITVDDKRFSKEMMTQPLPLEQLDYAEEKLKQLNGKLLYLLDGNHDAKLWRIGNFTEKLSKNLKSEYGTGTAKIMFVDKHNKEMFKLFDTHGRKQITSTADDPVRVKANMELSLKRQLKFKVGDCAVMIKHHTHKLLVTNPSPSLYLTDDGERVNQHYTGWGQNEQYIHPDARWYGNAGSFLKLYGIGYSSYAELGEYDPTELGFLILVVRDRKIMSLDKVVINI